jgi:hypothetical protein
MMPDESKQFVRQMREVMREVMRELPFDVRVLAAKSDPDFQRFMRRATHRFVKPDDK